MIPTHLAAYPWYAPHLAWLRSQGCVTAHDPGEAAPVHAYLRSANLHGADLRSANLNSANLNSANLNSANLNSANLHGAIGISSAGPVGRERRIIYAVRHGDGVMVQAGCWWGTLADTEARIAEHYAGGPWLDPYLAAVRLAAACVMV